jgi:hypothetical protein
MESECYINQNLTQHLMGRQESSMKQHQNQQKLTHPIVQQQYHNNRQNKKANKTKCNF